MVNELTELGSLIGLAVSSIDCGLQQQTNQPANLQTKIAWYNKILNIREYTLE